MTPRFYLGLDLGQRSDHSALAVLQMTFERTGTDYVTYQPIHKASLRVRHLYRFPLGTSYPGVAAKIRSVLLHSELQGCSTLIVDATGPGIPFLDFFTTKPVRASLIKVLITASGTPHFTNDYHYVSRTVLLNNLATLIQARSLAINTSHPEAVAAIREITAINSTGHSNAPHDDLAIAISLAAWQATRQNRHALFPT